jgi:hypothetical protein
MVEMVILSEVLRPNRLQGKESERARESESAKKKPTGTILPPLLALQGIIE